MGKPSKGLTDKQKLFCVYYVQLGSATQAYKQAYNCENMQYKTIKNNAHVLMQNNDIAMTIERLQEEEKALIRRDMQTLKEEAAAEWRDMAFANPKDLMTEDPLTGKQKVKSLVELPKGLAKCVSVGKGLSFSARDKQHALEMYCKVLGLVVDKTEVNTSNENGGFNITIKQ